jgi:hypothetical protein
MINLNYNNRDLNPRGSSDYVNAASEQLIEDLRAAALKNEEYGNMFDFRFGLLCKKLRLTRDQLRKLEAKDWERVEQKVRKWAEQAYTLRGANTPIDIEWVTGTRSPALIGMGNVGKKGFTDGPALVPTGQLVDWNIVPLVGELAWGIMPGGVNTSALSGAPFRKCTVAYDYSQKSSKLFEPQSELKFILRLKGDISPFISRLKIAVLRLIHSRADPAILNQAREHITNNILPKMKVAPTDWEIPARLNGIETKNLSISPLATHEVRHPLPLRTLVSITRRDGSVTFAQVFGYDESDQTYSLVIDREGRTIHDVPASQVSMYDQNALHLLAASQPPLSKENLKNLKNLMLEEDEHRESIEAILKLFDTEQALELSEQEKMFINDPFPLIWGTTSENQLTFFRVQSDVAELGYEGILKLGSDVRVAFTKSKKIEELKRWLLEKNVHSVRVMSLGTMAYLQAIQNK